MATEPRPIRPPRGRPLAKTFKANRLPAPVPPRSRYADFAHKPMYLTPEEVAEWLRVAESWVYEKTRRRCADPLPCIRIGRYVRFDKFAVQRWLRRQGGGAD